MKRADLTGDYTAAGGIPVGYYRKTWYYNEKKGVLRLYGKDDQFIENGNVVFDDPEEMQEFISLFLGRSGVVYFDPKTGILSVERIPAGRSEAAKGRASVKRKASAKSKAAPSAQKASRTGRK